MSTPPDNTGVTYLRTADIPLTDLDRFPGNAKNGDVTAIRASIRRHGQYRSLVVRDTGDGRYTILAGNHTHDAIRAEGTPTARCEVIDCDDDQARRINLADNRLAELGEMDTDALAELLSYLEGDYTGTGYTDDDVAALIIPGQNYGADDIPDDDTGPRWGVIIDCLDQQQQDELLDRLAAEGRRVRPLLA